MQFYLFFYHKIRIFLTSFMHLAKLSIIYIAIIESFFYEREGNQNANSPAPVAATALEGL
jgi:hypothetical protein